MQLHGEIFYTSGVMPCILFFNLLHSLKICLGSLSLAVYPDLLHSC